VEFLRRFVQHVLPKGFVKVRHYGLLANRQRDERLALCRRLLAITALPAPVLASGSEDQIHVPASPSAFEPVCRHCGSRRMECRDLSGVSSPATLDTS
jgi:hypothetical protein